MSKEGIIAVDPGAKGAIAVLGEKKNIIHLCDIPRKTIITKANKRKTITDAAGVVKLLKNLNVKRGTPAVIEHPYPGQNMSVISAATFGESVGVVIGVLEALGYPVTKVHPSMWKKALNVSRTKESSVQMAKALGYNLERNTRHDKFEAVLIGYYAMTSINFSTKEAHGKTRALAGTKKSWRSMTEADFKK